MEDANKTVETTANETVNAEVKSGKGITIGRICKWTAVGLVAVGAVIGGIILYKNGTAEAAAEAAADTVAE